ncbi:MAG TPA: hypothetical protein VND24_08640 [Steroidobacteraceae bacterium]|nr:hypothetical protein [Steroidobacteraceae bacterium]
MRIGSGLLLLLPASLLLAGCATPPKHYPSETAARYVGKPLLALEMHWSTPWKIAAAGDGQAATWLFNQYNLAGCTVTAHTDADGIIRKVAWTRWCGPKGTGNPPPKGGFGP